MRKLMMWMLMGLIFCGKPEPALAGVDVSGVVQRVWLNPNGHLYFRIDSATSDTYCQKGWWDMNMYIPAGDPNFAFCYGLLLTSQTKQRAVYLGNISVFNGSTMCDVTSMNGAGPPIRRCEW